MNEGRNWLCEPCLILSYGSILGVKISISMHGAKKLDIHSLENSNLRKVVNWCLPNIFMFHKFSIHSKIGVRTK